MTTTKREVPEVTITVSQPAIKIAGGWTGMRPVGVVRTYTTSVLGHDIKKNSKSEIMDRVRTLYYRETGSNRVKFTFVDQEG